MVVLSPPHRSTHVTAVVPYNKAERAFHCRMSVKQDMNEHAAVFDELWIDLAN
jgi:hypothetical protein